VLRRRESQGHPPPFLGDTHYQFLNKNSALHTQTPQTWSLVWYSSWGTVWGLFHDRKSGGPKLTMTVPPYHGVYVLRAESSSLFPDPPAPMNHVKIFKGWPLQDAPSKLVQLWYKSFPPGRFLPVGNEEANYVESNKRSTAWSCAENQIFEKSSEQDFKYLYWTMSKILLWNLITCKGT